MDTQIGNLGSASDLPLVLYKSIQFFGAAGKQRFSKLLKLLCCSAVLELRSFIQYHCNRSQLCHKIWGRIGQDPADVDFAIGSYVDFENPITGENVHSKTGHVGVPPGEIVRRRER